MAEFAVEVENVVKSYGRLRVLDGATIRVRRGEIYGLLGPNGAGKTTLIRALIGMVIPDSGKVQVLVSGCRTSASFRASAT